MRRHHARWLTRALASRGGGDVRIPTRRVDAGGFDALMRTGAGRRWADTWWMNAFDRADSIDQD